MRVPQFVPRNEYEEVVLLLLVGEAMAVRDAVLSQSDVFEAERAHSLRNAAALSDLLALAATRWGQLCLVLEVRADLPAPPPAAPRVTRAVVVVAVAGARHEVLVRVRAHVAAARAGHGRGGARPRAAPRAARARLARRARCVRFTLLPRLTILFLNDACPMFYTLELKRANRGPVSRWPTVLLPH